MSQKFLGRKVDELGPLLAQKAELDKKINRLKKVLKDAGCGAYEGNLFRATVSESISYKLNMDAVRAKLSPQFIRANERPVPKIDVKCVARTNKEVKVAA
jgi:hypothetical protein